MKCDLRLYGKLFSSTFLLSAFTFGGGYVIVPLMKQKFVDGLHWIEEQEMLDLTAIAQSAPGPIAVNAAILLGAQVGGPPGAAVAILGTILPPFLILSVLSFFYAAFRSNPYIAALLRGMQAGVSAVVASVTVDLGWEVLRQREWFSTCILFGVFLVTLLFPELNVAWIILGCALLGILRTLRRSTHGKEERL